MMDSFYDAPRRAPLPGPTERLKCSPVVPEISVLCPSNSNAPMNNFTPYNQWQINQNKKILTSNKENFACLKQGQNSPQNTSYMRKQVRFESPVLQQRPSLSYEPILPKKSEQNSVKSCEIRDNVDSRYCEPVLNGKTFEQIYMANIPNRHLDLSIVDEPRRPIKSPEVKELIKEKTTIQKEEDKPKTYKDFLASKYKDTKPKHNDSITDIFNYKRGQNKESKMCNTGLSEVDKKSVKQNVSPPVLKENFYREHHNINNNTPSKCFNVFPGNKPETVPHNLKNNAPTPNSVDFNKVHAYQTQTPTIQNCDTVTQTQRNVSPPILKENFHRGHHNLNNNTPSKCFNVFPSNKPETVPHNLKHNAPTPNSVDFNNVHAYQTQTPTIQKCDTVTQTSNICPPMSDEPKLPYYMANTREKPCQNQNIPSQKHDIVTQTSEILSQHPEPPKNDQEPTVRDLLKIITQQNEQLLLLQKQVATLINRDQQNLPKQIEDKLKEPVQKYTTSTQHEHYGDHILQEANNSPRKRGLTKFSIDLMTSFEVSFRPQQNMYQNKKEFINYEPKIQEITETETCSGKSDSQGDRFEDKTCVDTSMNFQEPVNVREACPSPEPSIKINMNDYDSSSDDDEVSSSEIGATFYQNLMGQVNKILRKAQMQTGEDLRANQNSNRDKTMSRVKEATLKHLRSIGVSVPSIDDSSDTSSSADDSKDYSPTEISFAVKQLLMKYLPDEHLSKVTYKETKNVPLVSENVGIIKNRPEFSFATVEYMKKYNLIASNRDKKEFPAVRNTQGPKILDISKLKQQPKLL